MLGILMFLFPRLRTKLVWAQALTYVKIIRTTLEGSVRMADQFPNVDVPVRGMAIYKHHMSGSCRTTRLIVITRVINRQRQRKIYVDTKELKATPLSPDRD